MKYTVHYAEMLGVPEGYTECKNFARKSDALKFYEDRKKDSSEAYVFECEGNGYVLDTIKYWNPTLEPVEELNVMEDVPILIGFYARIRIDPVYISSHYRKLATKLMREQAARIENNNPEFKGLTHTLKTIDGMLAEMYEVFDAYDKADDKE